MNRAVALSGAYRRIEIDEVPRPRGVRDPFVRRVMDLDERRAQHSGRGTQRGLVADARVGIPSRRHVEVAPRIQPEQPVVSRSIEIDEHRGEIRGIRGLSRHGCGPSTRVESLVANAVVPRGTLARVPRGEATELRQDPLHIAGHRAVTADEIRVDIREMTLASVGTPCRERSKNTAPLPRNGS